MKARAFITRAAAVGWLACLPWTESARGVEGPAGPSPGPQAAVAPASAPPAPKSDAPAAAKSDAPVAVKSEAPSATILPTRSPLDSEPIRRGVPENAPGGAGSSHSQGLELSRVGAALAIVIGLIFAIRWVGRKLFHQAGAGRTSRAVQVLARAPLAPRQHIVLVRVGRRVIVVGDCGSQMNALCEITDGDEIAALLGQLQDDKVNLPTRAFSALFQRAKHDMGGEEEEDSAASTTSGEVGAGVSEVAEPAGAEMPADDSAITDTRSEISGLMAKIRVLSTHFRKGET